MKLKVVILEEVWFLNRLASVGKPYSTENYTLGCVDGTDVYVMKN